jgi:hypothetical protein
LIPIPGRDARRVGGWLVGVLGAVGYTLVFVGAAHAAGWSAPQKVVSSRVWQYERPQLARDVFGDAVVVWHRAEELNETLSGVEAATRRANGAWTSPVTLPGPRRGGAYAPEVAMDSSGNATAAWQSLVGCRPSAIPWREAGAARSRFHVAGGEQKLSSWLSTSAVMRRPSR